MVWWSNLIFVEERWVGKPHGGGVPRAVRLRAGTARCHGAGGSEQAEDVFTTATVAVQKRQSACSKARDQGARLEELETTALN